MIVMPSESEDVSAAIYVITVFIKTRVYMQEYRSGHNEAVLKTVCPKGTGVRIPLPAPIKMVYSLRVDLFLLAQSEGTDSRSQSETGSSHTAGTKQPRGTEYSRYLRREEMSA